MTSTEFDESFLFSARYHDSDASSLPVNIYNSTSTRDWKRTIAAKDSARKAYSARGCSRRCRFGMPSSLQARSVAVVCWRGVLQIRSNVGCLTIPDEGPAPTWSRCWPRCRGRQARWSWRSRYCSPCRGRGCSKNCCLSRNHSIAGQSVVP